jgi:acyl-CoA synthetase (AMP-forming)/AMP-acid ligase II
MAWARATIRDFGIHPTDRTLGLGTLTQAAGEIPLRHALVAGSVWVATDRSSAVSLLDRLDAASPTWLYLPAGIVGLIDRELSREPGRSLSRSLRFVRFTSGGISVERLVEMEARFGIPIYPEYSSNEAGIIARVTPLPSPIRPGSVGKPFLEVEIVDERGAPLPVGSSGEIVVRGLTVSCGDLDAGEPERECFLPGGWLRTGDLGYQDSDGFLFVTGRMSGIINRGGAKILPDEVDAALEAHPAVAEAAAFGVPDDRLGEDIVAAVVLIADASVSPRQLRAWLLARISAHKMPRRFWFVSELPRTPTGKVRRGVLTRLWTDARTSEPVAMSDEQFGYAPSPSAPSQR